MPFVSYSQNREDVLLRRALADVTNGFYVDVGAQDPDEFSVTRTFYESGWRGVNIEPVEHWYRKLLESRPEDINVQKLVGTGSTPVEFYEIEDTGLSTVDRKQAEIHRNAGFRIIKSDQVPSRLDSILVEHNVGIIHFLKIDVEGSEADVIQSINFKVWRPWILVIEATIPMTSRLSDCSWQAHVEDSSYKFAYFDGLNKYFVASEKAELLEKFAAPPNVFDEYVTVGEKQNEENLEKLHETVRQLEESRRELDAETARSQKLAVEHDFIMLEHKRLSVRLAEKRVELTEVRAELHQTHASLARAKDERDDAYSKGQQLQIEQDLLRQRISTLSSEIDLLRSSTSWRMTAPIRALRLSCRSFLLKHTWVRKAWLCVRPVFAQLWHTVRR
ncbi:FkbM family methyltransferase [Paraburkholderia sp. MMS20-SJTR3]|uniref:FkbM family methyltransferase n=1 Tax=Paraburkholderia sejongensis TaxID=2886946 RepID=A0ABS8JYJ4_9BURK|nr:FkbM family methyltransferase [Paraburkholderia sp. MMS20-SJTR3]MCC8394908.1 FkbM family methyltransferase [Paraburkholderia sp. MMS20-SJTR3]